MFVPKPSQIGSGLRDNRVFERSVWILGSPLSALWFRLTCKFQDLCFWLINTNLNYIYDNNRYWWSWKALHTSTMLVLFCVLISAYSLPTPLNFTVRRSCNLNLLLLFQLIAYPLRSSFSWTKFTSTPLLHDEWINN